MSAFTPALYWIYSFSPAVPGTFASFLMHAQLHWHQHDICSKLVSYDNSLKALLPVMCFVVNKLPNISWIASKPKYVIILSNSLAFIFLN